MSDLPTDHNNNAIQAFQMPLAGDTGKITTLAGGSAKSTTALKGGMYRILVPFGVSVRVCQGAYASVVCGADDMPLVEGENFWGIKDGNGLAIYCTTAGLEIPYSLMP